MQKKNCLDGKGKKSMNFNLIKDLDYEEEMQENY